MSKAGINDYAKNKTTNSSDSTNVARIEKLLDRIKADGIEKDKDDAEAKGMINALKLTVKGDDSFSKLLVQLIEMWYNETTTRYTQDSILLELIVYITRHLLEIDVTSKDYQKWKQENEAILHYLKNYIDDKKGEDEEREKYR
jgi:hypothetical protein